MRFFSSKNNPSKIYIDENRKIEWIWTNLNKENLKIFLQETQLLKKTIYLALTAGIASGILLSLL